MARIATYTSFGLIVFAASAAGSLYLQRTTKQSDDPQETVSVGGVDAGTPDNPRDTLAGDGDTESDELPVVVRPRPASTEEILRLGATIKTREIAFKAREAAIQKERSRLKLIMDDIQSERLELESIQTEIHGKLAAVEKLLGEVVLQRQQLTVEREEAKVELKELTTARTERKNTEVENLKRMSLLIEKMDPQKAADFLRELANDGKVDMAVQLLGHFSEREAGKILDVMDETLVSQIFDKFIGMENAPTKLR